jgi:DNA-binding CsgD family transcriptional regulator
MVKKMEIKGVDKEIIKQLKEGVRPNVIADEMGIGVFYVYATRRRYEARTKKLIPRPVAPKRVRRKKEPAYVKHLPYMTSVIELSRAHKTRREIVEILKCMPYTVKFCQERHCKMTGEKFSPVYNTKGENYFKAVELRKQNMSTKEIALRLNLCKQTVLNYLEYYDEHHSFEEQLPKPSRVTKDNFGSTPEVRKSYDMIIKMAEKGHSIGEISEETHYSRSMVSYVIRKWEKLNNVAIDGFKKGKQSIEERKRKALRLARKGVPYKALTIMFGLSRTTLTAYFIKQGFRRRPAKGEQNDTTAK